MSKEKAILIIKGCIKELEAESVWSDFWDMMEPYSKQLMQALKELEEEK